MTVIFLHGLESSSRGTKASYFRDRFPNMLLPDFDGPLKKRLKQLHGVLSDRDNLVMVGSSFGGVMATIFAMEQPARVNKLILLAPALNFPEFAPYTGGNLLHPTTIYQGTRDRVTPCREVQPIARQVFSHLTFHEVDDDHSLHATFAKLHWHALLD